MSSTAEASLAQLERLLAEIGTPTLDNTLRKIYLSQVSRLRGIVDFDDYNSTLALELLMIAGVERPVASDELKRAIWRVGKYLARSIERERELRRDSDLDHQPEADVSGLRSQEGELEWVIQRASRSLTPMQVEMLRMLVVDGVSKAEVSRSMGIAPSTLSYHVNAMREALRPFLSRLHM